MKGCCSVSELKIERMLGYTRYTEYKTQKDVIDNFEISVSK